MIKFETLEQFLPTRRSVALLATLFERTLMRIDVAVNAGTEFHVLVTRWPSGHIGLVAFLTSNLDVEAGQRIAGLRVIELLCGFPIREVVALQAVVAELAFVHIFVARYTILRQPEKGLRKIFHFDECALIRNHVGGHVTFLAGNTRMLCLQVVARQPVIKLFLRRLPVNQIEVLAVVFQVAADAVFAVGISHLKLRVIAVVRFQTSRYFFMAIQAFESRRVSAELMAARALRRSREGLVRF